MPPLVIDIRKADDLRDAVHRAVQELAEGRIVAFPTETVYGFAASAHCEQSVASLFELKGRSTAQPLTLAVKSADEALDYVPDMSPLAHRLARRCWPGPITLVVDARHPDSLAARLPDTVRQAVMPQGTLGLRVPAHNTVTDVLQMMPGPIALTSANLSGKPDATCADPIRDGFGDRVSLILDDGPTRYGQPSTVVQVDGKLLRILREGVVPEATVRRLSSLMVLLVCTGNTCRSPMAEVLTRNLIAQRLGCDMQQLDDRGVIVMSAGLAAMAGGRPTPEAVHVMNDMGLALDDHASQPLTEQLVRHADRIFTMTAAHRAAIVETWPDAARRTELLRRDDQDVTDPIGGTIDIYRRCAEQIRIELGSRINDLELT